jgi:hypothetical protein
MDKYWIRTGFQINLVGGFNHSEKYESQLGSVFPILYVIIKVMFQPTNQPIYWVAAGSIARNYQPIGHQLTLLYDCFVSTGVFAFSLF